MGQAVRKFEVVEANASRSSNVPEERIGDRIGDRLMTGEKWLSAKDVSELAGVAYRVAVRAMQNHFWRGCDLLAIYWCARFKLCVAVPEVERHKCMLTACRLICARHGIWSAGSGCMRR